MLAITPTTIDAVKVVSTKAFSDARGSFSETYNRAYFSELGIDVDFVQDNQSISNKVGTIRGLHFQSHPAAQAKLVRVLHGRILDVAVDLRRSSPTYGKWVAQELTAEDSRQLFIPVGFAHGFCTLQPKTQVFYKTSAHYSPANDHGVAWNDPDLAIDWPISPGRVILSEKDAAMPSFKSLPTYFE